MKYKNRLCFIIFLLAFFKIQAQETEYKRTSIKTGLGFAYNETDEEMGGGIVYFIGIQKSYGKKERLRINPNMMIGGFSSFGITDVRDQFYRITSLGLNIHYDVLRFRYLSVFPTLGGFINYSRGLLGTGGEAQGNRSSEFFAKFYFGGNFGIGIRIAPPSKRIAYEIKPLNIQIANNAFVLGYGTFGIDIRFRK